MVVDKRALHEIEEETMEYLTEVGTHRFAVFFNKDEF